MTPALPEFSRRVELARLGTHEAVYPIVANESERRALARRFDLLSLDRLEAEIRLQRLGGGLVRVSGRFAVDVVQTCVVSLEPVASAIDQDFAVLYGPAQPSRSVVIDLETELVEPFGDNAIDIGEAVAEQLALALDPYPRAPGASLEWSDGSAELTRKSPIKG